MQKFIGETHSLIVEDLSNYLSIYFSATKIILYAILTFLSLIIYSSFEGYIFLPFMILERKFLIEKGMMSNRNFLKVSLFGARFNSLVPFIKCESLRGFISPNGETFLKYFDNNPYNSS
jgi:hypothetical protein